MRRGACRLATASALGAADASLVGSVRGAARRPPPLRVYRDVVTEDEEASLVADADKFFRRTAFTDGHFDNVIVGYREAQKPLRNFSAASRTVLERLTAAVFPADTSLLPVHLLDLSPDGYIQRHVDHVEYSGAYIVGLSLLSDAVMTLHLDQPAGAATGAAGAAAASSGGDGGDVWLPMRLPRRSMYVLHGEARYQWAHAVPLDAARWWGDAVVSEEGKPLRDGRRLAVLFRDAPPD